MSFICIIFFLFTFCFTSWSYFISYFNFNQISCCFCRFLNYFLEAFFAAPIPVFVSVSINVLPYLLQTFLQAIENHYFNIFSIFCFYWISHFYNIYPVIRVILTLSSISSCLLIWSVNHTSVYKNSVFVVFSIVREWDDILINWPNSLFGTKRVDFPCEENREVWHNAKVNKYRPLKSVIENNDDLFAVDVGAKGCCSRSVLGCFTTLGLRNCSINTTIKLSV